MKQRGAEALERFWHAETDRLSGSQCDAFMTAFAGAAEYVRYLHVIAARYRSESADLAGTLQEQVAAMRNHDASPSSRVALSNRSQVLSLQLQLDTESYYLFAKILADKLARFVQFYFGNARGLSLRSHDQLSKNLAGFCTAHKLVMEPTLQAQVMKVKAEVCDYRDKKIAHEQSPYTTRGLSVEREGAKRILFQVPPSVDLNLSESDDLAALEDLMATYCERLVEFLAANRERSRFGEKHEGG